MELLQKLLGQEKGEDLKRDQITTIAISLIGAIVASTLSVVTSGFAPSLTFITLTFAINIAFISDRTSRFRFENKTEKELARVISHMSDMQYLGDSETGARWFIKNYHGATRVINAVFNRSNALLQPRLSKLIPELTGTMKRAIEAQCSWTDVYLPSEEDTVLALHDSISVKHKSRHAMLRLECDIPLLQLILIEYSQDRSVTLFGWVFSGSKQSRVYKTEDPAAFNFFENYLDKLIEKSTITNHPIVPITQINTGSKKPDLI